MPAMPWRVLAGELHEATGQGKPLPSAAELSRARGVSLYQAGHALRVVAEIGHGVADFDPVDADGPVPVYQQVADRLEARIREGEFGASGRMPGRDVLAVCYGVGVGSVSHAVRVLEKRGLAVVVPGRGMFTLP